MLGCSQANCLVCPKDICTACDETSYLYKDATCKAYCLTNASYYTENITAISVRCLRNPFSVSLSPAPAWILSLKQQLIRVKIQSMLLLYIYNVSLQRKVFHVHVIQFLHELHGSLESAQRLHEMLSWLLSRKRQVP